jgi:hypothetical protein
MFKNIASLRKTLPFKNVIKETKARNIEENIYDNMGNMKKNVSRCLKFIYHF